MGQRGPRPEPTALKIARGNPGKRALNHDEPELTAAATTAPKGLPARALAEWKRLAPELVNAGVLTVGDLDTFETYCKLVADVDKYEKLVKKVGLENAHKLGYANYLLKLRAQKKQYAAELGLTPTSRSGVKKIKGKKVTDGERSRFFGSRQQVVTA